MINFNRIKQLFSPPEEEQGMNPFIANHMAEQGQQSPLPIDFNELGNNPVPKPVMQENDDYDVARRMGELYQPEHKMSDAFGELLANMPKREKISKMRRLAGIFTAMAVSPEVGDKVMNHPYDQAIEDWKLKAGPLQQGANLEKSSNSNARTSANQIISQELRDKGIERQINKDRVVNTQNDTKLKQTDQRIKIQQESAKGGQLVTDMSGTYMVYKDGSKKPVDVDLLSKEELEELKQNNSLERIGAQGAQSRATKAMTGGGSARDRVKTDVVDDPDNPGRRIVVKINMDTNEVTPVSYQGKKGTTVEKSESATQDARRTLEKARQIKLSRPEWAGFVKLNGNEFSITKPGRFSGPTKEVYDQIYSSIYGAPESTTNNAPSVTTKGKQTPNTSEVKRIKVTKNGKVVGTIPDTPSQRAIAAKSGYKVE